MKPDDKLYEYHNAVNEACFSEAIKDPTLLKHKRELQHMALMKEQTNCTGVWSTKVLMETTSLPYCGYYQ